MVAVCQTFRPVAVVKSGSGTRPPETQRNREGSERPTRWAMPFTPTIPGGRRGPGGLKGPCRRVAELTLAAVVPYSAAMEASVCPFRRAVTHCWMTSSPGYGPRPAVALLTIWWATPSVWAILVMLCPRRRA